MGDVARSREIAFLQEQNSEILEQLSRAEEERDTALETLTALNEQDATLGAELQGERDKIGAYLNRFQDDRRELAAKDEHVKTLGEQNADLLTLLEAEENKASEASSKIKGLQAKNSKLQAVAEEFDVAKAEIEKHVQEAKSQAVEILANVKNQRNQNEVVRANIQNTEAKTRVDIESLQQALQVVEAKNLEYLQRINKQEAKEKNLQGETAALKEELETVRADIDKLRKQLEGDDEGRTKFERNRNQVETAIEALEVQADTLKKALNTAERANEQLQEENRTSAERCRETADKVYALMDSLRLNQVELKKQEAENSAREKKLVSLERATSNLKARISMEQDAKVLADQERKEAEQEAAVLKKKNRKVEESITTSQSVADKLEKEISDYNDKVSQLSTQNAYLTSRLDGQEEEKNCVKAEIKKTSDRLSAITQENTKCREDIENFEESVAQIIGERDQLVKELEYIKREDVLDEAGRQRPILIQSSESDLIDKLQINDFLVQSQQSRNPVPPMIEKIAQLLAMLHEGQSRADQYLGDLSKSNGLVTALRKRNAALFAQTQMFDSFKTRALSRYVMNLIEGEHCSEFMLDALNFGPREISELINLIQRYDCADTVFVVSLIDNGLDEDATNIILQMLFQLPYLKKVDLRRNCFDLDAIRKIEDQLRQIEGVTGVIRTADHVVNVHSGNQLRLSVDLSEQVPKSSVTREVDFTVDRGLVHEEADPFLGSAGGTSMHPWTKTPAGKETSQLQAVPDPSSIEPLAKPSAHAAGVNVPVGIGGPGSVAKLTQNRGQNRDRVPQAKAQAGRKKSRAKAAPPDALAPLPEAQRRLPAEAQRKLGKVCSMPSLGGRQRLQYGGSGYR